MMNLTKLRDWQDDARREMDREIERLQDRQQQLGYYQQAFDMTDELLEEIDNLTREKERNEQEIQALGEENERLQREVDNLRRELVELKEQRLDEATKQAPTPQPTEIHNHFETGCTAQVFNDKVDAKFIKKQKKKWKKRQKQNM